MPTYKSKILLVDDHEIVRNGLKSLLESQGKYQVVGQAENGIEAINQFQLLQPDIVLMDIRMPLMNGIEACQEIISLDKEAKVLMLTSHTNEEAMVAAIMAGATGYVKKKIGINELLLAIDNAVNGQSLIDYATTQKIIQKLQTNTEQKALNEQEKEILNLIGNGKTNKEIAESIILSEKTVRNYVSIIFGKLNFSNRTQAAIYAVRKNMFDEVL